MICTMFFFNHVAECSHYIGVMFQLLETGLDIVCMYNDIIVWVRNTQVPDPSEDPHHHPAIIALQCDSFVCLEHPTYQY